MNKDQIAICVDNFEGRFVSLLPETYNLLRSSNLVVHPLVRRVFLHGSRGLAGGYRPDSDIDLSLIVGTLQWQTSSCLEGELRQVVETTLHHWQGTIELDLAIVFDSRDCGLACFDQAAWDDKFCKNGGSDCFGLYKLHTGFNGFVTNAGVQVKLMYPCIKIWQRL